MTPAHRIAAEFSRNVRSCIADLLTHPDYVARHHLEGQSVEDVMKEINRRNREEYVSGPYRNCCGSADFCDANMPMADAFEVVVGREHSGDSDADTALWNRAWEIAKRAEFRWKEEGSFVCTTCGFSTSIGGGVPHECEVSTELSCDECDAIGVDSSGRGFGPSRPFPLHYRDLTADEAQVIALKFEEA